VTEVNSIRDKTTEPEDRCGGFQAEHGILVGDGWEPAWSYNQVWNGNQQGPNAGEDKEDEGLLDFVGIVNITKPIDD